MTSTHGKSLHLAECAALLLALFVVTVRPLFPGLSEALHRNLLITMIVLMSALLATLTIALRRRLTLRAPTMTVCLVGFLVVVVVATFFASYRFAALVRMTDLIAWALLTVVLVQLLSTPYRARLAVAALVATLAVLAAYAFYQYVADLAETQRHLPGYIERLTASGRLPASLVTRLVKRATSGDVFGTFIIANSFAGYLIIVLPVAFALALACWRRRRTRGGLAGAIVAAAVTLAAVAALVLTQSKGGMLAFALVIVGATAWWLLRRGRRVAAAAAALVAALVLTAQTVEEPPRRVGALGASAAVRIEYWRASVEIIKRHPLLGVGPGNWQEFHHTYRRPEGSEADYAHNDYLEIAAETGIVGLLFYLAVWVTWFLSLGRRAPAALPDGETERDERRPLAWCVAAVGVGAVVYVVGRFVPTAETAGMIVVGSLVWLAVFGVQVRHLLALEDASSDASLLRGALVAGVCAFLLHSAIDFDLNVPGITRPLACVAAAALALRPCDAAGRGRPFGTGAQLALTAAVAVPIALLLAFVLYPFTDMSIALAQARNAEEAGATLMTQAEQAHKAGDARTAQRKATEGQRVFAVDVPRYLKRAIAAYGGNVAPWAHLARLEVRALHNRPTADLSPLVALIDRMKTLQPNDPAPYDLLAYVLVQRMNAQTDPAAARQLAERALVEADGALERYPTRPQFRLTRAEILDKLGRNAEAVAEYLTALDHARRTSMKEELKFTPEEVERIRARIDALRK